MDRLAVVYYPFFRPISNKKKLKISKFKEQTSKNTQSTNNSNIKPTISSTNPLIRSNNKQTDNNDKILENYNIELSQYEENYEIVKTKIRAVGKDYKHFQRFTPTGGLFGVFG